MNMARTDPDPSVRSMAIRALNRARDKRAIPIFLAALDEKNDSVRLEGAKGLANIPDPTAVAPLIRHLDNLDENVDVRVACADALRLYRTSEVAQALVRGLRDRNFGIAWQSRKSLQLMTGKDFRYDTAAWLTYLSGTNKPFG
jgi:HEAT repeat protein